MHTYPKRFKHSQPTYRGQLCRRHRIRRTRRRRRLDCHDRNPRKPPIPIVATAALEHDEDSPILKVLDLEHRSAITLTRYFGFRTPHMPIDDAALTAACIADGPLAFHQCFHGFGVAPELHALSHGELDLLEHVAGEDAVFNDAQAEVLDGAVVVLFAVEAGASVQVLADGKLGLCGFCVHYCFHHRVEVCFVAAQASQIFVECGGLAVGRLVRACGCRRVCDTYHGRRRGARASVRFDDLVRTEVCGHWFGTQTEEWDVMQWLLLPRPRNGLLLGHRLQFLVPLFRVEHFTVFPSLACPLELRSFLLESKLLSLTRCR